MKIFKIFIYFLFFLNFSLAKSFYFNFLKNIKTLEIIFLQLNYLPYQNNPDTVYQGIFIFQKPDKFYIRYIQDKNGNPIKDYIISDGKKVKIFIAENNETKIVSYKDLMNYFPFSYLFSKDIYKYFKLKNKIKENVLYLIPKFESDYNLIIIKFEKNKKFPIKYIKISYSDGRRIYFIIRKVLNYNKKLHFRVLLKKIR